MSDILRAVSLFVPPYESHNGPELNRGLRPFTFETVYESSARESNEYLTLPHILQTVGKRISGGQDGLLLFIGDQGQDRIPEVMGAFVPIVVKITGARGGDQPIKAGDCKFGLPKLLFHFQSSIRLFRSDRSGSLARVPADEFTVGHVDDPATSYWIGDPNTSQTGFRIDPDARQITFMHTINAADQRQEVYGEVFGATENSKNSGEKWDEGVRSSFTVTRIAIYRAEGGEEVA